jgi:hypothetical protein
MLSAPWTRDFRPEIQLMALDDLTGDACPGRARIDQRAIAFPVGAGNDATDADIDQRLIVAKRSSDRRHG